MEMMMDCIEALAAKRKAAAREELAYEAWRVANDELRAARLEYADAKKQFDAAVLEQRSKPNPELDKIMRGELP